MFTTNLSIIIITGTGAGYEPQTKVHGPEDVNTWNMCSKAKLNRSLGRCLDLHTDWDQKFGLPPAYHPRLYSPHECGVISVDEIP